MDNTLVRSPVKNLPPISEVTHSLLSQTTSHHYSFGYQPSKNFYNPNGSQSGQHLYTLHQESQGHDYIQPELFMKNPVSMLKQNSRFPMADAIPKPNFFFPTVSAQDKLPQFYSEKIQEMPGYAVDHNTSHYQETPPTIYTQNYSHENYCSQNTEEDEDNTIEDLSVIEIDSVPKISTESLPISPNRTKSPKNETESQIQGLTEKPTAANIQRSKKRKGSKSNQTRPCAKRWTESDDDKVAFLREYGNLKWHEVTEFINGRHTPQAVQMRYLRSLKRRNDNLTVEQRKKLANVVEEDYHNRFKRISIAMGPAFTPLRIQKLFLQDVGLGSLLKPERVWTKEEISAFIDAADGDFDSLKAPQFGEKIPPAALKHIEKYQRLKYEDLVEMYIGKG